MDALDIVLETARPLLGRVDDVLRACGVPGGHPAHALLRELGALPGAAAESVAALRPGPLVVAQRQLGPLAEAYAAAARVASRPVPWSGPAAQAYAHRAGALSARLLGDGGPSRLADTIQFAESLALWMVTARTALARALGRVIGAAEAVALTDPDRPLHALAGPAADVAAEVLAAIAAGADDARRLAASWEHRVAYAPFFRPLGTAATPTGGDTLRIGR
ncbi:MAG TPA: hypothetical protein VFY17_10640 [Pilimelia sp.]|nr:hypothetical protein [Pilimelia sp.]